MADEQDRAETLDDDAQPVVASDKPPGAQADGAADAEPPHGDPDAEPPAEEGEVSDPGGDSDPDPAG